MAAYVTIIILSITTLSCALQPKKENEDDIQKVMKKYFDKIPNVDSKYVINEGLSKIISSYFNGTVNAFPLFKINIKIDPTPVKIPWTLDQAEPQIQKPMKKKYKYYKIKKNITKGV